MTRLFASPRAALATAALLGLCGAAFAADPRIDIPDFGHLKSRAIDSTDITVGTPLLRFAAALAASDANDEDAQALQVLRDVKSVRVRNYEFDEDGVYSKADIDAVRRQLTKPGWSEIVQHHKRGNQEEAHVYVCIEGDRVLGLAVLATEPRSLTIVNIVGEFDIDKLAKLEGQFHIPRTSEQ